MVSRLVHEVSDEYQLTWPEFKRDPFGFTKRTFVGYGNLFIKFMRKPNVPLAMGAAFHTAAQAQDANQGQVLLASRTQAALNSILALTGLLADGTWVPMASVHFAAVTAALLAAWMAAPAKR